MANQSWIYEPTSRWIRASYDGKIVANSKKSMLMIESSVELDYYFPKEDIRLDLLEVSDHVEISDRGKRIYWNLKLGETIIEKAAWTYEKHENRPDFRGYIAITWHKMDHWHEEEEEVFDEPRNPYYRVDTIKSSRHIEVFIEGIKIADTRSPNIVFETHLPTRYYIPKEDVQLEHLIPNNTKTVCPYKGFASYYDVKINKNKYENIVWTYLNPIPEAPKLKNMLAFWPEKDKRLQIFVDGELKNT